MIRGVLICFTLTAFASPAIAGEACQSAKDIVKMAENFYAADADRVDIITPTVSLRLSGINGAPDPTGIHYFHYEDYVHLPVDDNQVVQNLDKAASWSKDGKMCRMEDGEIGAETEEDQVEANIGFTFPYKRQDGNFTMDEILEGAKDGSKVMKGVAPSGLGFVVPGLKAITIYKSEDAETPPILTFSKDGKPIDIAITRYETTQMVLIKHLKSAKVDALKIDGAYRMNASFKFDPEEIAAAEARRIAEMDTAP